MAASDAKAIPIKNAAYRVTFPIYDFDGDLVTGAAGLDSEVDKDGAGFNDLTDEEHEIGSSGMYYLDLTNTEMNADTVTIIVKTTTAGAKTTPITLYTAARSINDLAFPTTTGRSIDVSSGGEVGVDWANVGTPGSTVDLSGTTVKTATDVASKLPSALTAGSLMKASIEGITDDTALATAFARSVGTISVGTVGNGSSATAVVVSSITPAITVDNQLSDGIIKFARNTTTTNLRNRSARILSVTNSSQTINLVTADSLPATPASGDTFVVL